MCTNTANNTLFFRSFLFFPGILYTDSTRLISTKSPKIFCTSSTVAHPPVLRTDERVARARSDHKPRLKSPQATILLPFMVPEVNIISFFIRLFSACRRFSVSGLSSLHTSFSQRESNCRPSSPRSTPIVFPFLNCTHLTPGFPMYS